MEVRREHFFLIRETVSLIFERHFEMLALNVFHVFVE